MKTLTSRLLLPFAAIAMTCSTSVFAISDRVIATFDTDTIPAADDGGTPKTLTWSSVNAAGGSGSGSLYLTVNYLNQTGWQDSKLGLSDPGSYDFAWPGIDCTLYVNLEFDIKVDQANSFPSSDGNYGGIQVVLQGWDGANGNSGLSWTPIAYPTIANNSVWQHVVIPLTSFPHNLNRLVLNFFGNPVTNTISYWLDNVKLTAPPAPPPTLQLAKAPPGGLTTIASQPAPQGTYQRQIIRTATGAYSFHTANAASNTPTYSLTIADFPGRTYSGFIAQMFLIPQYVHGDSSQTNMQYGPTDSAIDWNSGSVIYWTIGQSTNGNSYSDFRVKTNLFSQQYMAFNDQPGGEFGTNGYPVGHLAALTNTTAGPVGTWTLTFNNNTNVTIKAADGTTTNFVLNSSWADYFQDPLYAYVGIQPNDNARIGQSATFSRVKISGSSSEIDDTFTSSGPPYLLDTNTWAKSAADGSGIFVNPPDASYWLSWTTPDPGFQTVYATDDIKKSLGNNEWADLAMPPATWLTINNRHMAVITQSGLATAFGGSAPSNSFFALSKPNQ